MPQNGKPASQSQPRSSSSSAPLPSVETSRAFSAEFTRYGVAADHALASRVGAAVLRDGGNAVDAAVATSFALSVVRPYSCGIGGGGFMLVHFPQGLPSSVGNDTAREPTRYSTVLDYRETCPAAVDPFYFEQEALRGDRFASERGGLAVAIPGHVRGMLTALKRWGTITPAQALAGAIAIARDGYEADAHYVESCQEIIEWMEARDSATQGWLGEQERTGSASVTSTGSLKAQRVARFAWLWERMLFRGNVRLGDRIVLPEKAELLERISREGDTAFYAGECAQAMVDAVQADGGVLTLADLEQYSVKEREPFVTSFQGRRVLSMPPPSSGGIVLAQVLAMLEARRDQLRALTNDGAKHNSAEAIHLVAECCKHAFADRAHYLGDTDFVHVPVRELLDARELAARAMRIDLEKTQAQEAYGTALQAPPMRGGGTSHLCVVDGAGNAVACTETINLVFGSLVGVPSCGFMLNDTMDDFLTRANTANAFGLSHADRNRPQPGKRPLSAMTPTIVLEKDAVNAKPVLLAGASGGPRIISGTLQAMLNMLVWKMPAWDAVGAARFHHQWSPHVLQLEDGLIGTEVQTQLEAFGHEVNRRQPVAAVQVMVHRDVFASGECAGSEFSLTQTQWQAASDPRKGGAPAGE